MSILLTPTSSVVLSDSIMSPNVFLTSDRIVSTVTPLSPYSPIFSPLSTGPLTLSLDFSKPVIGFYESIDTNPEVRKKMLDYYYDLIRDKWLLDDLNDVLNYFVYRDGKVSMIKNLSEYSPSNIDKDTDQIAEKKVEYLEKNVFTKYNLMHVLEKFTKEINSKWVDLVKNEFFLKQTIKEYIIREIKKKLKGGKPEKEEQDGGDVIFF